MTRIAIIGSGIAGLAATHILVADHQVTLYEAANRFGGHSNTVTVDDPDAGELGIDTGFIVHNDRNYPFLQRLFRELNVPTQPSEMSFGVTDRDPSSPTTGFTYRATNPNTLFADRRNLARPPMWRMLADIARFYRNAQRFLAGPDDRVTIDEFLAHGGYGREFVDLHLVPMGAAVWSAEPTQFREFPATSLLRFLDNHGLLSIGNRPEWRTVVGGSRTYVDTLIDRAERLGADLRRASPVASVRRREAGGADVVSVDGSISEFDRVIIATHSDQALAMLDQPTDLEASILSAVRYQPNRATLHTDTTLMPPERRAWAAWNYDRRDAAQSSATLTYDMTLLQRLGGSRRYLVSLNSDEFIDPAKVVASFDYAHPVFDHAAVDAQRRLGELGPDEPIRFAGAWCGYGFHEDGIAAAVRACEQIGARW